MYHNGCAPNESCAPQIEHNPQQCAGAEYTAQIQFLAASEWEAEVKEAFALVCECEESDVRAGATPEEDTPAHEAWDKLRAAYGKDMSWTSASALLAPLPPAVPASDGDDAGGAGDSAHLAARRRIHAHLGKSLSFHTGSARELCRLYSKCVDSVNDGSEGSLWPIVKRVVLRGPWHVLSHGVRLVDAPGLADDNSARDAVVKKVLQEANCVWLVSNIRRAVNDKTVKDMMPPSLKQVLVEQGVLGSLVFVATQSDIIVRSEVAENLNLGPDVSVHECAHRRNAYFRTKLAADFKRGINLDLVPTQQQPVLCSQAYRSLHAKCKAKHARGGELLNRMQGLAQISQQQQQVMQQHLDQQHREHLAFLHHAATMPRQQGENFELASFAVSAVDYQKLMGVRKGDGPPAVFSLVQDTQVSPCEREIAMIHDGIEIRRDRRES